MPIQTSRSPTTRSAQATVAQNFISGAFAFAGSDSYLSDDEGELTDAKSACGGEDPIEVPAYVSPIAVAFNLEGVDSLNLSAKTIAQIFDGKITKWNDPLIANENEGVDLPDTTISPVHRSDDSGTTDNFTDYLSKAGEGAWSYDAGRRVADRERRSRRRDLRCRRCDHRR